MTIFTNSFDVTIALRDSAQNMISAFEQPGCNICDVSCCIHILQLVVSLPLHQNLIQKKIHKITSFANQSNIIILL